MPLIVMSGLPSSGKSTRALQLSTHFLSKNIQTKTITDLQLKFDKSIYKLQNNEKRLRAALLSATERHLSTTEILILDSNNYIKGFRYQLFCIAKALGTTCCVVYCAINEDMARGFNSARDDGYEISVFEELVERFEEPDAKFRWDHPLFTILPDNIPANEFFGDKILDHLIYKKKTITPNYASVVKPLAEPNYLFQLDKITQEIIQQILAAQKDSGVSIVLTNYLKANVDLPNRNLSLPELMRMRRQFTQLNKLHTIIGEDNIAKGFTDFLNSNFTNNE